MTVREIAEQVGCSEATVSRVLNGNTAVDRELRESVLEVAREVQYRREGRGRKSNAVAKSPVKGIVEVICLRTTPYEPAAVQDGAIQAGPLQNHDQNSQAWAKRGWALDSYWQPLLSGLTGELRQWNVRSSLQYVDQLEDVNLMATINQQDVAGVILLGEYGCDLDKFVTLCRHPLVLVDLTSSMNVERVVADNVRGIFDAFAHLAELGHRKIGFMGGPEIVVPFQERLMAYKLKMIEAGWPVRDEWISHTHNHIEVTTEAATRILSLPDRPTALICCNDYTALGVYRAAAQLGIRIPDQLSVVGFDDIDLAGLITPLLTTLSVPKANMGRLGARQLMLQMMASEPAFGFAAIHMVPVALVKRGSTAAAPV